MKRAVMTPKQVMKNLRKAGKTAVKKVKKTEEKPPENSGGGVTYS